jgi:DNA-binding MarR family transcriptional regulator
MDKLKIIEARKLSQQHAYASLQFHETISRKAGFAATDHKYLGFFLQKGSLTAGQLAELTGLTTGAVTGLIDRFEKKKLVKRQFDNNDRRKVNIVPDTKKIMALFEPFYKEFQKGTENMIATFSEKEITVIQLFLKKAIALMQETKSKFNQ